MTMAMYRRDAWLEIDLDAIIHNISQFRSLIPSSTKLLVPVKANAYGHGAIPVARIAVETGADYLGVATADEGIALRQAGITLPILVLGYVPERVLLEAMDNDLTLTVFDMNQVKIMNQMAKRIKKTAMVHIKVDTGMGRIGMEASRVVPWLERTALHSHLQIEGLFTHFSTADSQDKDYFNQQHQIFSQVIGQLQQKKISIPLIHCANSAATLERPHQVYNMVRPGISLYGYYPSPEVDPERIRLRPALTLRAKVVQVKRPPSDFGISYGKTYIANGSDWIATIPLGYGDGISRHLSNQGFVLIKGKRVPIVGRITMDQLMVRVNEVMPVAVGDEVVVYGRQGEEEITVDEVAEQLGTIHYEIVTMLGHRLSRLYYRQGQLISVDNSLCT